VVLGLTQLIRIHKSRASGDSQTPRSLSVLSIAAITLANGADNIGVYVPFFLANRTHLLIVLALYGVLVFVWCFAGKWLGNHALVLKSLGRWGHWVVPFFLIALGCYILLFLPRT
jgi:cadmium resistance protein CadD (predicted permease)